MTTKKNNKVIRNLRNCMVHIRLHGDGEKPYYIKLAHRGAPGDFTEIPEHLTDDPGFLNNEGVLFEVITKTEARQIHHVFQPNRHIEKHQQQVSIVREQETVVAQAPVPDSKGRTPGRQIAPSVKLQNTQRGEEVRVGPVGPTMTNVPGADAAMNQAAGSVEAPLPTTVRVEGAVAPPVVEGPKTPKRAPRRKKAE